MNALDYSVGGDARIWIRAPRWTRLLSMREVWELPRADYQTLAMDLETYEIGWRAAGLWDGDGSHVCRGQAILAQKSHAIVQDLADCFLLDGIFPIVKRGPNSQLLLSISRTRDFGRFVELYPLRHVSKRTGYGREARRFGRDKATGLWKCPGLWAAVAAALRVAQKGLYRRRN